MRDGIHPEWHPEAKVTCACGNTFTTGATQPEIRTDVCSACHPFFTGEQRIVDTAGQVERFMRRLEKGKAVRSDAKAQREAARDKQDGKKKIKVVFEDQEQETPEPATAEE
ncbi:MAG: 50S ribosomal protein L31 [Anaerolineae bacterium]